MRVAARGTAGARRTSASAACASASCRARRHDLPARPRRRAADGDAPGRRGARAPRRRGAAAAKPGGPTRPRSRARRRCAPARSGRRRSAAGRSRRSARCSSSTSTPSSPRRTSARRRGGVYATVACSGAAVLGGWTLDVVEPRWVLGEPCPGARDGDHVRSARAPRTSSARCRASHGPHVERADRRARQLFGRAHPARSRATRPRSSSSARSARTRSASSTTSRARSAARSPSARSCRSPPPRSPSCGCNRRRRPAGGGGGGGERSLPASLLQLTPTAWRGGRPAARPTRSLRGDGRRRRRGGGLDDDDDEEGRREGRLPLALGSARRPPPETPHARRTVRPERAPAAGRELGASLRSHTETVPSCDAARTHDSVGWHASEHTARLCARSVTATAPSTSRHASTRPSSEPESTCASVRERQLSSAKLACACPR